MHIAFIEPSQTCIAGLPAATACRIPSLCFVRYPTMHSSRRPAPRPLRRPLASAATPTPAAAPPAVWEQAAAAATVLARNAQGGQINVQVLCWPIVPTAWALLQQALQLVQASRMSVG